MNKAEYLHAKAERLRADARKRKDNEAMRKMLGLAPGGALPSHITGRYRSEGKFGTMQNYTARAERRANGNHKRRLAGWKRRQKAKNAYVAYVGATDGPRVGRDREQAQADA